MSGEDIVFVLDEKRVSRQEYINRVRRGVTLLRDLGLKAGDCVGIALHNRPEFFEILQAATILGIRPTPIAWRLKEDEVRYLVEDSGARLVIYDNEEFSRIDGLPGLAIVDFEARLNSVAPDVDAELDVGFVQMQLYSSGTTGRPKAIERQAVPTQAGKENVLAGSSGLLALFGVGGPDEVHLMCGPLYHSQPIGFANSALGAGHRVVMMSGGFDAEKCLATIEREKVTWITCVPTHLIRIMALPEAVRNRYDLSSLKAVIHSAAPCPLEVKKAVMNFLPENTVWEIYGGTEGMISIISPQEWLKKPGSVGKAFPPGAQIRILDPEGNHVPIGESGLIYGTPLGKWRYRGADANTLNDQTFLDDLFTLGDVGYLDEDGYLFITDRLKDMIISGGSNIYPAEVEAELFNHPAVADATVIGVPDAQWGESVKAIVEPRDTVTEQEIIDFCRSRLAHYKCPKTVELVDRLPRDPNGKVRKRELRDRYWGEAERRV